jgi:aminopeptidase N
MKSLVASVVWDEARFGLPLDLERFMIVAVERLQHGGDGEQGPEHLQHQVRAGQPATATDADFAASRAWSATSTSTTGPATASPAATGSSCR